MNELNQRIAAIDAQHRATANFEKTVALLAALKAGTVSLDNVEMVADGWRLKEVVSDTDRAAATAMKEATERRNPGRAEFIDENGVRQIAVPDANGDITICPDAPCVAE